MKRKLRLALAAILSLPLFNGMTGMAQETVPETGGFYLYNEEADVFLSRGAGWGTQAVVDKYGVPFDISCSNSEYKLTFFDMNNTLGNAGGAVYTDNGNNAFTFEASGTGWIAYNKNAEKWLTIDANNIVQFTDVKENATAWNFKTLAEYATIRENFKNTQAKTLAEAAGLSSIDDETALQSYLNDNCLLVDKTSAINNPSFSAGNADNWTFVIGRSGSKLAFNSGATEIFEGSGTLSQTITGLEKGIYKVSVNAFYRDGSTTNCAQHFRNGWILSNSRLIANGYECQIKDWASERIDDGNPNNMSQAVAAFSEGRYLNEVYAYVGDDGNLDIVLNFPQYNGGGWAIFDNVTLTYYEVSTVTEDVKNEILNSVPTGKMSQIAQSDLDAAKAAFESNPTIASYNTLVEKINAANASITVYANNKAAIDANYALIESTNVYTTDAYETFKGAVDAYQISWDAGTLTETVVNPSAVKDWHTANAYDDYLLSAWTIGGAQAKDFETALYINTWSVEGESDGSNFKVPFFEYWTGDDNTLAATTISATVEGVAPGYYDVSVWIRPRLSNGQSGTVNGITMQVNDGTAMPVTGTQIQTSQFYINTVTASGEVGEDGILTIKLNVTEGNNVSWLAFRNVKYSVKDINAEIEKYNAALEAATAVDKTAKMGAAELEALNSALSAYGNVTGNSLPAYIEAIDALTLATNNALLSVSAYANLKTALDKYTERTAFATATTKFDYYTTVKTGYDNGSFTVAETATQVTELRDQYRTYLRDLEKEYKTATAYVTTTEFESNYDGWQYTTDAANHGISGNPRASMDHSGLSWENYKGGGLSEGDMYYVVNNLPAGKYFVRMAAMSRGGNDKDYVYIKTSGANIAKHHLYIAGDQPFIYVTDPITVAEGEDVEIGFHIGSGADWVAIDAVQLYAYEIDDHARTTTANMYGTICLPFNATVSNATLYTATLSENNTIVNLTAVDGNELTAGTPYIYAATADAPNFTWKEDANLIATPAAGGVLVGVFDAQNIPAGAYVMQTNPETKEQKFYIVAEDTPFNATMYRAYLSVPGGESKARSISIGEGDGETTAIEKLFNGEKSVEGIYGINGVRHNTLQKGINIIKMSDGTTQKVIVK